MEDVINTSDAVPIKLWNNIDEFTRSQAVNLAQLPFARKNIALMADAHAVYGMPIGGVLAAEKAIIPNAVGVDIGCGMLFAKVNNLKADDLSEEDLDHLVYLIKQKIPVGFAHRKTPVSEEYIKDFDEADTPIVSDNYDAGLHQLGTLGGGNHFIEIQYDSLKNVYIMIHSGSRKLGYNVAQHYRELAEKKNFEWHSKVPSELAFFPKNSQEFDQYMMEMQWCVHFAQSNRLAMMHDLENAFFEKFDNVDFDYKLNKPHNYAVFENHFSHNFVVHRKGVCRAGKGELVMIPGSQGTSSYIVEGLGNEESFKSCSHGAGRKMGRKQAKRSLDFGKEKAKIEETNSHHAMSNEKDLEEAPGSYKDIEEVITLQEDLVKPINKLYPLATIKG